MVLTAEQEAIINSTGNIKINAVAGSGKTSTIIEYARARMDSSILYLAFNKAVKTEAAKKFADLQLNHVRVETAHSLAYKEVVFRHHYKVRAQGYKTPEIVALLGLQGNGERHAEYIVANHINKFVAYFCNSDKQRVQDLNYLDIVTDPKAKTFVTAFYAYIEKQTRMLLAKMDKGEIEITHDFYLKKFQLSAPQFNYDYILFDEGQDASPAMLDVFLKQRATKVIVGDTHQQIYGWRFAVNSLEKADFQTFQLSTSFRFGQDIANLAMQVLTFKKHIDLESPVSITGKGIGKEQRTRAVLARTNLGLLLTAIEYVMAGNLNSVYFEGNINSYTYADEGTSLYDVLNLYNGNHSMIRDSLIKGMKDLKELEEYNEKTEDVQLSMMVEVVKEYGKSIPTIIKSLKDKHVGNDEKEKADMIFSTVHRCKGMEYDEIQLVNDFITGKKLEKIQAESNGREINVQKLNEEINLFYVAVTRAKRTIYIPEALMPAGIAPSAHVNVLKPVEQESRKAVGSTGKGKPPLARTHPKSQAKTVHKGGRTPLSRKDDYTYEAVRDDFHDAYTPWNTQLDDELAIMHGDGVNISVMAEYFGKPGSAIKARIKKLGLT